MAAVSTFPSGRGLASRGAEPDPNGWEHHRRNSQDVSLSLGFSYIGLLIQFRDIQQGLARLVSTKSAPSLYHALSAY